MRLIIFLLFFSIPYAAWSSGPAALGTNDVSFLLPFINGKLYPDIKLSEGQILNENIFKQIINFETIEGGKNTLTNKELIFNRDNWHLTSFRFDPCSSEIEHAGQANGTDVIQRTNKCVASLRLVFQPLNSQHVFVLSALHLVYGIPESEMESVIGYLQLIKNETESLSSTNAIGLTVHPGLAAEANQGSYAIQNLVRKLLTQFAVNKDLVQMTGTLGTGVKKWKLVGGIIKEGSWVRAITQYSLDHFNYDPQQLTGVEEIKCTVFDICLVTPVSRATDDNHLNDIFLPNTTTRPEIERQNKATLVKAEDIENPIKTNFFNTSCVSCHVSSAYRDLNELVSFDSRQYPETQIPFTFKKSLNLSPSSLINFGYESDKPKINFRVANESILAAEAVNQFLNADTANLRSVGAVSQFWNCIVEADSFAKCL